MYGKTRAVPALPNPGISGNSVCYDTVNQRRSRAAATSKVELFVIIVNGFQPLTIITKDSTLDVAAVLALHLWSTMQLTTKDESNYYRYKYYGLISFYIYGKRYFVLGPGCMKPYHQ